MLDQQDDGSHEITLHEVCRQGCKPFPNATGTLRWSITDGVTFRVICEGIQSLKGTEYFSDQLLDTKGVGNAFEIDYSLPDWTAKTDDGTDVRLYAVQEQSQSTFTNGTVGSSVSCGFSGKATFAIVDILCTRRIAFENNTPDDHEYRLFSNGARGRSFHDCTDVEFCDTNGTTQSVRCSTTLQKSPEVAMVASNSLVACMPSSWISYQSAPTVEDCGMNSLAEQLFLSFLNGRKLIFPWADRRLGDHLTIRRTYFGWQADPSATIDEPSRAPLPMWGGESFEHGEKVRDSLGHFYDNFASKLRIIDFAFFLSPIWTAIAGVLQDRRALAYVSLERLASVWDSARGKIVNGEPNRKLSIWKNKQFKKSTCRKLSATFHSLIGEELIKQLNEDLNEDLSDEQVKNFSEREIEEFRKVITNNILGLARIPNSEALQIPFVDLDIVLSETDKKSISERNKALHGKDWSAANGIETINTTSLDFDRLSMLVTKFVLRVCEYKGPYFDYASRPLTGNFEVKCFPEAIVDEGQNDSNLGDGSGY